MPGTFSALSRLIFVIFALGHLERKIMPKSQPSGWTSEEYLAAPVTLAGASMRLACDPMWTRFSGQPGIGNHLGFTGCADASRFERRLHNARIGAAPA